MSDLKKLQKLVSECTASILYLPIQNEIDYNDPSFALKLPNEKFILPKDKNSDPFQIATECIEKFGDSRVLLLIPGKKFDIYGTRHGRGAGWYDRFLSKVPASWLRIGVADKFNLSDSRLPKQKWDESVDWILIKNDSKWEAYKA